MFLDGVRLVQARVPSELIEWLSKRRDLTSSDVSHLALPAFLLATKCGKVKFVCESLSKHGIR